MNFNKIYLSIASFALLSVAACSPDSYDLATPQYSADDLVEGIAYTVTPDANNPNIIHLTSLVKGCTPLWDTPQGRSQSEDWTIDLPFAGQYEVTFGVMTRGGNVYGAPYTFTVGQNDFSMLSDDIWTNLAGGVDENGKGNPKKWVPCNMNYGIGRCSGPVMYMSPTDVKNDGSNISDLQFGSDNWTPNWDPGFLSWLIPADDPYMGSYMTLGLDATKGCTAEISRVTASGTTVSNGKFSLNISDPKHPTITFSGCSMLHAAWGDAVCDNYTVDVKIIECTPYLLQFATMRTNDEGPWWIVWNFVSEEVKNDPSIIPSDKPSMLEPKEVEEPTYDNLAEKLFTISGSDATYISTKTTYLLNEDKPYDFMWWNGASGKWEWIEGYNSSWAPAYSNVDDFSLVLEKSNGTYKAELSSASGDAEATFTISGNKIVFDKEITLLEAGDHVIKGKEFTVMRISPDDSEVVLGVPDGKDASGAVNRYLCANMTIKAVGGGQTGPTEIKVDNSKLNCYIEANDHYRIELYNPWGDKDWPIDISKVKLKKNQTLTIKFKLSGVTWKADATPKVLLAHNIDALGFTWPSNGGGFDVASAVDLNKNGETTVTLTNTTGSTVTFSGSSCVTLCISCKNMATDPIDENGLLVPESITPEITSITIQ
jgi:hypothetical protein